VIKTLAFIKRRADVEREAFRDHYEEIHAPLALPLLDGLVRYVRHHVEAVRIGEFSFDVLTAFSYRDKAATDRLFARLESEEGRAIREDELTFMDTAANRFFAVSERAWLPSEAAEEGDAHTFVAVSRPAGMSRYDACANLTREYWPGLLEAVEDPHFALSRDCFPVQGDDLVFDSLMQVGARSFSGLDDWSKRLEAEGYRVCGVETRSAETPL
jgi:uncharacterized protein (TIGR02118 family)